MKKRTFTLAAVLTAVLLFVAFSAVSAEPNAPIECVIDIEYDDYEDGSYWYGPVSGCILEGNIKFVEDEDNPSYFAGKTLHFFEKFTIYLENGAEIHGTNAGVGHFYKKFKFRANGWVTGVTNGTTEEDWTYLIGYKTFEMGTSSDPTGDLPITAHGTLLRLVPTNRQSAP